MFNISEFTAEINSSGIVKPSNYEVFLHRRKNADAKIEASLKMRCASVVLPGRTIQTVDKSYYGPTYKIGYESQFTEVSMTILLSEDWREKEYFELWQDEVVGNYRTVENFATTMYDIGYYDDYVGDMTIHSYDDTGKKQYSILLYEAWPTVVGEVQLSHAAGSEVAYLPIQMTYKNIKKVNS